MFLRSGFFIGLVVLGLLVLAALYVKEEMPHFEEYLPPVGMVAVAADPARPGPAGG